MEDSAATPRPVTIPKRVPLTEEQQRNYQRTIEQDLEQKEAAKSSKPTRIAGWWAIAGFLFEMATAVLENQVHIGAAIYLIAGILILKGKQAALRFVIVLSSFNFLVDVATMSWSLALQRPLLAGTLWFSPGQLGYWVYAVVPAVIAALQIQTGMRALNDRELPLWTKTVKQGSIILGMIVLINAGTSLFAWHRNRQLGARANTEIELVRSYYQNPGNLEQALKWEAQFKNHPRIQEVTSRDSTKGSMTVYVTDTFKANWRPLPKYEEYLRDSSGNWFKWEVVLATP